MPGKIFTAFFLLLFFNIKGWSQACTTLGQNPSTAFPVCGVTVFNQQTVPVCGGKAVPVPSCNGDGITYQDLNPFWYSFTCYTSGTLGFLITPKNSGDDYDWQLYDITGHDPNEIYTNPALIVTGNWSGTYGITGAEAGGSSKIECASNPAANQTTFSAMPAIAQGHKYLLLISHFSGDNQSGYALSFGGGTGSITDSVKPVMQTAIAKCDAQSIYLKLNKRVKCSSLAVNGSDFYISPSTANIISATGGNCNASFDMDSVVINLNKGLQPGNYSLVIQKGNDSSTLIDNCDNTIPELDSIPFTVYPLQPTPMDSLTLLACAPDTLQLVFRNGMKCSSIAADGTDFIVSGNTPVSVVKAFGGLCSNGISTTINVVLSKPMVTGGSYNIILQKGSDGNTLIDECAQETPAGSTIAFTSADTVSADFAYRVGLGCVYDTLLYRHDGRDHVNQWNWTFDVNGISTAQDSIFLFNDYGSKHIQLLCNNGVCSDSASADILLDNQLSARFAIAPSSNCALKMLQFTPIQALAKLSAGIGYLAMEPPAHSKIRHQKSMLL